MPRTYGPYPEQGAPRGAANCADVRERLGASQPVVATLANVCAGSTDFPLGMERLLSAMQPGRAARHPLLLAGWPLLVLHAVLAAAVLLAVPCRLAGRTVRPRGRSLWQRLRGRCGCGRQAEPGQVACRMCASWLETYLSQPDATPDFGAERSWRLARPPAFSPGETVGEVDVSEFENGSS